MAMLVKGYWDDSEDAGSRFFGVGGFVGSEEAWNALEPKWLAALPAGIDHFQATDCFTGNNQFEPAKGFNRERRIEVLDTLTDLVCDTDIKLICHAIDVPKYIHFAPKKIENEFLGNRYVACLDANIQTTCRDYMQPPNHPFPISTGDVRALFYEESNYSDSVGRHVKLLRNDEELWWRERIGNATPGTKTGAAAIPLLQVADLGVFLGTKFAASAPNGNIPWQPYFEKLRKAGRVWGAGKITQSSLAFLHAIFSIREDPRIVDEVWNDENRVSPPPGLQSSIQVTQAFRPGLTHFAPPALD